MRTATWFVPLLGVLLMVSCRGGKSAPARGTQNLPQAEQLGRISRETGLTFPSGSRVVEFTEPERVVDPVWAAKVVMPASAYDSFSVSLLGKTPDNVDELGAFGDSVGWWRPAHVVLTKQFLVGGNTIVKVVVSEEVQEIAAYIECVVF